MNHRIYNMIFAALMLFLSLACRSQPSNSSSMSKIEIRPSHNEFSYGGGVAPRNPIGTYEIHNEGEAVEVSITEVRLVHQGKSKACEPFYVYRSGTAEELGNPISLEAGESLRIDVSYKLPMELNLSKEILTRATFEVAGEEQRVDCKTSYVQRLERR